MGNPFSTETLAPADKARARVIWKQGKAWRLVWLATGRDQTFPPGKDYFLERQRLMPSALERKPIVVLGEAGSGLTSLVQWMGETAAPGGADGDAYSAKFVRLDASLIPAGATEVDANVELVGQLADEVATLPASAKKASHLASALRMWADSRPEEHILLLDGVEGLPRDAAERLFAQLRGLVEEQRLAALRLVVISETEQRLAAGAFSSFIAVSDVFRTPMLTDAEIESLWRKWGRKTPGGRDVAAACLAWTGGQPLLVQTYLHRLFEGAKLADIGPTLEARPPSSLRRWQTRLAAVTRGSALLRRKMQAYVAGQSESSERVDADIEPLFVAGWIRQDEETGRWGIRSRAHAAWALKPLRHPERFADSPT